MGVMRSFGSHLLYCIDVTRMGVMRCIGLVRVFYYICAFLLDFIYCIVIFFKCLTIIIYCSDDNYLVFSYFVYYDLCN